ncbi:MAG: HD domain-containing phosphohydrolase [Erysipelotrichaceae bacterium]|nr:HD domain-containing phosphohydrolase [Erysipelotrichaceae bacterium]
MIGANELRTVVEIGIQLTAEKSPTKLWDEMVNKAMEIVSCDAGTLYLYKDSKLEFRIMKTLSMGVNKGENGEKIDLPPVPLKEENVCAFSAIHHKLINIEDVYTSDEFDFSGPKKYDAMTGYRTGSMMVVPLENTEGLLVGVLQLINKLDEDKKIIPFSEDDEFILRSMGSMAAMSVTNLWQLEEIKEQMHSFVRAFASAVDERTPYNGSHTRKVTVYANILAKYINEVYKKGECSDYFDDNRREQLSLAATLHDIGKMIVPLEVMNKASRLESDMPLIESRFELLKALYEKDFYKGLIDEETYLDTLNRLNEDLEFIRAKEKSGFMPDDALLKVEEIGREKYIYEDGRELYWLSSKEKECLSIRKGTLTADERVIMENHVVMTKKILGNVHFNELYSNVSTFASMHHEYLDGSGYPEHLKGDELPLEARIMAVVDIYDALTSRDRPYKEPMPRAKAFAILNSMADEGKLEKRIVEYLQAALENISDETIDEMSKNNFDVI